MYDGVQGKLEGDVLSIETTNRDTGESLPPVINCETAHKIGSNVRPPFLTLRALALAVGCTRMSPFGPLKTLQQLERFSPPRLTCSVNQKLAASDRAERRINPIVAPPCGSLPRDPPSLNPHTRTILFGQQPQGLPKPDLTDATTGSVVSCHKLSKAEHGSSIIPLQGNDGQGGFSLGPALLAPVSTKTVKPTHTKTVKPSHSALRWAWLSP